MSHSSDDSETIDSQEISFIRKAALAQSKSLLERLGRSQQPYRNVFRDTFQKKTLEIRGLEDCIRYLGQTEMACQKACQRIDPSIGIPVLIQTIPQCYYGPLKDKVITYGPALKSALAFVASGIYKRERFGRQTSVENLQNAIWSVDLFERLRGLRICFETYVREDDYILIGSSGVVFMSENMSRVSQQAAASYNARGKTHRTLEDSNRVIWGKPLETVRALENILNGEEPRDQDQFKGTLFSEVPKDRTSFWLGLLGRLLLAAFSMKGSNLEAEPVPGICFFSADRIDALPDRLRRAMRQLVWDSSWYQAGVEDRSYDLIVERPLIHINDGKTVLATTWHLAGDSLNWFVEASVMPYPTTGVKRLPDKLFRKYVSAPFEEAVNEIFRKHGFLSGKVEKTGTWFTQGGHRLLTSPSQGSAPGEIDALAYHQEFGVVFVAECKVLAYPMNIHRARNLHLKIQPTDSKGFYSNLENKRAWLAGTAQFANISQEDIHGIIMLDRKVPGMILEEQYATLDLEMLEITLESFRR